ncbi:hypothetical protein [Verrucomicrobium spinosum]|uniref:hypothetical protein n=1 Tax=Verrucomicrobium spinosum TaxID=2736 RepID=UPI0018DC40EE|nr:hypothetical protein [Verrucomicrobium spinosum]
MTPSHPTVECGLSRTIDHRWRLEVKVSHRLHSHSLTTYGEHIFTRKHEAARFKKELKRRYS